MKKTTILLSILLVLSTLTAMSQTKVTKVNKASSPCDDSVYLSLKSLPMDKLTEREYSYFLQKDKACSDYQKMYEEQKATKAKVENEKKSLNAIWIVSGICLFLAIIIPVAML